VDVIKTNKRGINQTKNLGFFLPSINNQRHNTERASNPKIKDSIITNPPAD